MPRTEKLPLGGRAGGKAFRASFARGLLFALVLTLLAAAHARFDPGESTGALYFPPAEVSAGADLQIVPAASQMEHSSGSLAQRLDPGSLAGQTASIAAGGQAGGAAAEDLRLVSLAVDAAARSPGLAHTRIGQWLDRGGSEMLAPGSSL